MEDDPVKGHEVGGLLYAAQLQEGVRPVGVVLGHVQACEPALGGAGVHLRVPWVEVRGHIRSWAAQPPRSSQGDLGAGDATRHPMPEAPRLPTHAPASLTSPGTACRR